jgi:hypothetical protein
MFPKKYSSSHTQQTNYNTSPKVTEMGKAKKSRSSTARAIASPTARPLNPAEVAANAALRESKIIPVVKNLGSTNTKQRSEALSAIVNLLEDSNCRNLLLRERVVQKIMEGSLNDSNQEVVVYGWGALRNVAAEEGYDQCIFMYRKDILTPVAAAITTVQTKLWTVVRNRLIKCRLLLRLGILQITRVLSALQRKSYYGSTPRTSSG